MRSTSASRLGRIGEQMAARHLERCGYEILARNWRSASPDLRGELDIVARDGTTLVFCEVKARRGMDAGGPLAAVTGAKVAQLRRLAGAYVAAAAAGAVVHTPIRIDVVGVCWHPAGGRAVIEHVRDIDDPGGLPGDGSGG